MNERPPGDCWWIQTPGHFIMVSHHASLSHRVFMSETSVAEYLQDAKRFLELKWSVSLFNVRKFTLFIQAKCQKCDDVQLFLLDLMFHDVSLDFVLDIEGVEVDFSASQRSVTFFPPETGWSLILKEASACCRAAHSIVTPTAASSIWFLSNWSHYQPCCELSWRASAGLGTYEI